MSRPDGGFERVELYSILRDSPAWLLLRIRRNFPLHPQKPSP